MEQPGFVGIIAVLAGLFCVICAACDYGPFMKDKKAKFWVDLLGRKGARVFYIIFGLIICGIGVYFLQLN